MLKKYLWKKAIKKACSATEGLEDTFANYLTTGRSDCRNPNAAGYRNNSDWRKGTSCSDCKKHVPEAG